MRVIMTSAVSSHTHTFAATSPISGQGLFAARAYAAGERLFILRGRLFGSQHRDDDWFAHSFQLDRNLYLYPEVMEGRYINHSCEPNAGLREDLEMIALCDIPAGAEICFDYSTCMSEKAWTMACACGAPLCRRRIGDFHDLPFETKRRYLKLGVVQRFIVREIFEQAALASNSRITATEGWSSLAADLLKVMIGSPAAKSALVNFSTSSEGSEGNGEADAPIDVLPNVA